MAGATDGQRMSASGKPFDPYDGAFFCRHCLLREVPARFCNRPLLLEHLKDEHQIQPQAARETIDIVCGWMDALAIRDQPASERERGNAATAALFATELESLDSVALFLERCAGPA